MILKGSQRSDALKLAAHLLRLDENDHVEIHELRGYSANDLRGALQETEAIAKGTRCRQSLFSVSLNPPDTAQASVEDFVAAAAEIEDKLGLTGQPRALVFHEKEGRRHAHAIWSRINVAEMKAINLPFYKLKLKAVSRELFLEHGWRLPEGLRDRSRRNPLNFSQAEWQQAKRVQQDTQALKLAFQECWTCSDTRAAFEQALGAQGFLLARGDRRGFVAVDYRGEIYSLSRWTGAKSKALKDRLGDPADLPDVAVVQSRIAGRMTEKLQSFIAETEAEIAGQRQGMLHRKTRMRTTQRAQRHALAEQQIRRSSEETARRVARFRKGMAGLWDWLSGKASKTRKLNEQEAEQAALRDARERETLSANQLSERRDLQRDLKTAKRFATTIAEDLRRDVAFYMGLGKAQTSPENSASSRSRRRASHRTPQL